jgi:hypothetical protein
MAVASLWYFELGEGGCSKIWSRPISVLLERNVERGKGGLHASSPLANPKCNFFPAGKFSLRLNLQGSTPLQTFPRKPNTLGYTSQVPVKPGYLVRTAERPTVSLTCLRRVNCRGFFPLARRFRITRTGYSYQLPIVVFGDLRIPTKFRSVLDWVSWDYSTRVTRYTKFSTNLVVLGRPAIFA